MATWDATKVKSQIRLTAYRLAQLQEKHDQTSNITKRDIATLISQGDIEGARSKVERLIRDDRLSALIEGLESYCSTLLARFMELDQISDPDSKSPAMEAVCGLILAAPHTDLKDVMVLRDSFEQKYGVEFIRLAAQNYGNHVPSHFVDTLSKRTASSAQVDVYMVSIAKAYQLTWTPPMLPHQKAHALSEILDPSNPHTVNIEELRQICSKGVPKQPPWLRPRVWKLLLGTLPPQKDSWEIESHSKRQSYYELARRFLTSMQALPPPTMPLTPLDISLLNFEKSLTSLPAELDEYLELSPLCPFDDTAPEGLRIETAGAVDDRLRLIRNHTVGTDVPTGPPQIRLEIAAESTPQISVTSPPESPTDKSRHKISGGALDAPRSSRNHTTSLLRLLYIHTSLHPSTPSTSLISLLIPMYVTMIQEIEPTELAHVEADTFWLFAELWGEVGELTENGGSQEWMFKFGKRLAWADLELWNDMTRKGLDPALPHYSYRWLAPLLTHTLSLQSVLTIWDALFTRASRTSDHNAKLEFLLDVCTSMLIHVRVRLFRLGKAAPNSPGLWGDVDVTTASPSLTPFEVEEAFIQGMTLLQIYPMTELGGPERVIDIAVDLTRRREHPDQPGSSLGEKLRGSMWNRFMTRTVTPIAEQDNESDGTPSPEWPDSGAEDGDATETPAGTLLGKIGGTVWRGITNKSSMDVPPSPLPTSPAPELSSSAVVTNDLTPASPSASDSVGIGSRIGKSIWRGITNQSAMEGPPSPTESIPSTPLPDSERFTSPNSPSALWSYTEKLKDSNTAATLSKVSTNWTAKAATLWGRSNPPSAVSSPEFPTHNPRAGSLNLTGKNWTELFPKRSSLPSESSEYSAPPRPNFRESRYFSPGEHSAPGSPSRSVAGLPSPPDLLTKGKSALASLKGTSPAPAPKAGPRPLLLNSSSLITPSASRRQSRSPTPVPRSPQNRDSMSSVSSTSQPGMRQSTYSDRESEPGNAGRFIPLRRGAPIRNSVSPRPGEAKSAMRPGSIQGSTQGNESEPIHATATISSRNPERRTSSEESARRGWGRVELPDSPSTLPSSPPPRTPITSTSSANVRVNGGTEKQRGSMVLSESGDLAQEPQVEKKILRKKSWNTPVVKPASQLEDTNDSSTSQESRPQIRSKRHGRPTNLRLKSDPDLRRSSSSAVVEQKIHGDTTLMPENVADTVSTTPRAADFPSPVSPGRSTRMRKLSRSPRRTSRRSDVPARGSGGEEGDDEGYDDFLSAYESEDGATAPVA